MVGPTLQTHLSPGPPSVIAWWALRFSILPYPDTSDAVVVQKEVTVTVNKSRSEHRIALLQWDEDLQGLAELQA